MKNKPTRPKVLKLKKWLTLPEAAKHLSVICGEDVTEADTLQFVLTGDLKLSVVIDKPTWAHECEIVPYDADQLNAEMASGIYTEKLQWREWNGGIERASSYLGENKFLNVYDRFVSLRGMFDLPLFGDAWIAVEKKLWELSGSQKTGHPVRSGIFLENNEGSIFQLKNFINEKAGLPSKDALLVVRTDALADFAQRIDDLDQDKTAKKPHGNTEINAQKREEILGAALSVLAKWPEQCKNGKGEIEATKIRNLIEEKALLFWRETGEPPLSTEKIEREIRKWLNTV